MRCPYCFQAVAEGSTYCPNCGSRLVEERGPAAAQPGPRRPAGRPPRQLTPSQSTAAGMVLALVGVGFVAGIVALLFPSILPRPVIDFFNLGTPVPSATPQVTRSVVVTLTPLAWAEHANQQAGFTMQFPVGWLVVNQAQPGWEDIVKEMVASYGWAESLFETGVRPQQPRTRAVDPAAVNIQAAQVVVFTVGLAPLEPNPAFAEIEALARGEPAVLALLAGGLVGENFTAARSERTAVNGRQALLIEFTAQPEIINRLVRVRVRLYFVPDGERLYLVSYFAEEELANRNRAVYDQIVQSFTPAP